MKNKIYDINTFLDISMELTAERDKEKMLSKLLDRTIDFADCDAGTLYLLENDGLNFSRMVTKSLGMRQGGSGSPITLPPVPMNERFAAAACAMSNEVINIPDVAKSREYDFDGAFRYDKMTGYDTRSMLVVPMVSDKGRVIGVLQLINAMDEHGRLTAFDAEIEPYVMAIASQASISITNIQYSKQIDDLVSSLASALAVAIDQRTQYHAMHTRNMVRMAKRFIRWLDDTQNEWYFTETRRKEFLLSVWLHNIGEISVPISILNKDTRLGKENLSHIESRFKRIHLLNRVALLENRMSQEDFDPAEQELTDVLRFIRIINTADGKGEHWLSDEELDCLYIRKGTLTKKEREKVEDHAVATANILSNVSFPKSYARVPIWAGMHHELLNGRGYPEQADGSEISRETRLITILDIFEALTAPNRPYRDAPLSVDEAIGVLHDMAYNDNSIDKHILMLFEHSEAWTAVKY